MADHLREIGLEGFYLIDNCYGLQAGRRGRRGVIQVEASAPRRQGQRRADEMEAAAESACINSRDAASIYGGINVVNYTTPPPYRRGKYYY
ncbi:hypothetical protein QN277_026801 [Acacia crassicarpa]|uniref:Uncharacterized protein n=1 Tax=Acacia crassicarpa TaxID=499986 RepID=A0AAE1MI72_9FABA|nr:hypothetical protein QN277_026801 [Acacia crassicarpa]